MPRQRIHETALAGRPSGRGPLLLAENPVLVKEMRVRMRGARAYQMLLGYVSLLTTVLAVTYFRWLTASTPPQRSIGGAEAALGRQIFESVFLVQGLLVATMTPALTAGGITREREQGTFDAMAITRLRPDEIVFGKLGAALGLVWLLLTSSLPFVSLTFYLGGVSPGEILSTYAILALIAVVYGALGVLASALASRTPRACVMAYVSMLALFAATAVPGASPYGSVPVFRSLNPITVIWNPARYELFYAWQIPSWLNGIILLPLAGVLLAQLAAHWLTPRGDRLSQTARVSAGLLWVAIVLSAYGFFVGSLTHAGVRIGSVNHVIMGMLALTLITLFSATPFLLRGPYRVGDGVKPATKRAPGR